ncbi:MAG TPA: hypothetical protein VFJ28_09870 [Marmoricola sp.]|nr:hypothetical protein [Marmoricola sp.]
MDDDGATRDDLGGAQAHSPVAEYLTPPVCAVAAFTLAVAALLGQNVMSMAVGTLLERTLNESGNGFALGWGVAVAVQVGLVWLLARRSIVGTHGWVPLIGRAAIVLSLVALVAGALVVLSSVL